MAPNETEQLLRRVLVALEHGVPLDWTDVRVYVVIVLAAGIGSVIGAYAQAFFSKRGEIAAIKKDLDQITKIPEQIRASISGRLWIDQNFWNLKREVYWKLTSALSRLSSAL